MNLSHDLTSTLQINVIVFREMIIKFNNKTGKVLYLFILKFSYTSGRIRDFNSLRHKSNI